MLKSPELGEAGRAHQDVPGLDVPVNHAERVRVFQRVTHLEDDMNRLGEDERAFADELRERAALDVLHDDGRRIVPDDHVVDGDDVRMIEARDRGRLATEAPPEFLPPLGR